MISPTNQENKDYGTIALLGAFCLFLSTVEFMIPKPLPFLRLGLANLPILIGLTILSPRQVLTLVLIKVLGQGMVNGTLFSYIFLFSASGSLASALVMIGAFRLGAGKGSERGFFSLVGISLFGALASNLVQLLFSSLTVFGEGAWLIAPPFLAAGGATAIFLGLFAENFRAGSLWLKATHGGSGEDPLPGSPFSSQPLAAESRSGHSPENTPAEISEHETAGVYSAATARSSEGKAARRKLMAETPPGWRFLCGLFIMMAFIFQEDLLIRAVQTGLFILLSIFSGKRFRPLPSIIMLITVTILNLLSPYGRILFSPGGFDITAGALERGLYKGLLLAGLIVISRTFISPRLNLPGRWGRLLGRTLGYFERITENSGDFDPKHPVISLDQLMVKVLGLSEEERLNAGKESMNSRNGKKAGIKLKGAGVSRYLLPAFLAAGNLALLLI